VRAKRAWMMIYSRLQVSHESADESYSRPATTSTSSILWSISRHSPKTL